MARHGENIRKRTDGRWEGRYPVYNTEKKKQVYRSVYGKTYEEVREKLYTQKNMLKSPSKLTILNENRQSTKMQKDILFTDAAREWLITVKGEKKRSTYVKYSLVFRNHIENAFSDIMLSEITDILVSEKISEHISDNTLKSIYCILNQVIKYATQKYFITVPAY